MRRLPGQNQGWGIRARLVCLFVGTVALLSAAMMIVLPKVLDRLAIDWYQSRSLGIVRLLGRLCAVPLDFDDRETATGMLAELQSSRGAVYATLHARDGRILASWRVRPPDAPLPSMVDQVFYTDDMLHLSIPVATRTGPTGSLAVGFSLDELKATQKDARLAVFWAAMMALALGIAAAIFSASVVIGPLGRVTSVARRIATGDTHAQSLLPLERRDEVGALARAFDAMLQQLYQKEAGMSALAADLEKRVADRTTELQKANKEIAERLEELTRTQEQLIAADRRVSIGRLAAGVAHEINNPLSFIDANLVYLSETVKEVLDDLQGPEPAIPSVIDNLQEMAGAIADSRQGTGRVRHIVKGLKRFSGKEDEEKRPVSVSAALEAALDMAAHEVKHKAHVVTEIGPMPYVTASEIRLSQVFLNLLVNAGQAIPEGAPERNEIRVTGVTDPRGWAVIEVKDTGPGISPQVRAKIFEPFFTTKPIGEGTGLGLSISRGLIEGYGGRIEVESAQGKGTTFRVSLPPSSPSDLDRDEEEQTSPEPGQPPRRRLLVVDDEPLVCASIERSLGRDHDVVSAGSARAALERLAAGSHFDLILCDVTMPDMTGIQLYEELTGRYPDAAASLVFMTGGAVTAKSQAFLDSGGVTWLQKPLDLKQLGSFLK